MEASSLGCSTIVPQNLSNTLALILLRCQSLRHAGRIKIVEISTVLKQELCPHDQRRLLKLVALVFASHGHQPFRREDF